MHQLLTKSPAHDRCPFRSSDLPPGSGILDILTNREKIQKDEVVNIITDLFRAAADTVSPDGESP